MDWRPCAVPFSCARFALNMDSPTSPRPVDTTLNTTPRDHSPTAPPIVSAPRTHDGDRVLTLLNVEDDEPSRFKRGRLFRNAGYRVVEAASTADALAAIAREAVSVALVDVNLSDGSGLALCETLKRLDPRLPVLLISSAPCDADLEDRAREAGAHEVLRDPVTPSALLRIAADAMSRDAGGDECLSWVMTDRQGLILDVSDEAARLLSGTARGLLHRSLIVFFEQDREGWEQAMARAKRGGRVFRVGRLRPKERRPVPVRVEIVPAEGEAPPALIWRFLAGH